MAPAAPDPMIKCRPAISDIPTFRRTYNDILPERQTIKENFHRMSPFAYTTTSYVNFAVKFPGDGNIPSIEINLLKRLRTGAFAKKARSMGYGLLRGTGIVKTVLRPWNNFPRPPLYPEISTDSLRLGRLFTLCAMAVSQNRSIRDDRTYGRTCSRLGGTLCGGSHSTYAGI